MFGEEGNSTAVVASIGAGLAVFLMAAAMMPGMLLVALIGGTGEERMPEDALALCQDVFIWPLSGYGPERVTSRFGPRASPGGIGSTDHKGIDIGAPSGTAVRAACGGVVVKSAYHSIRGNYVEIDHGGGVSTLYQHMSERKCDTGDVVSRGDVIGLVGRTGHSTGSHLHFEVRVDGTCYDPMQIYQEGSMIL